MSSARNTGRRRTFPAFTEERAAEVVQHLRDGQNRETAAELVGLSDAALRYWFAWGEGRQVAREPPGDGSRDRFIAFVAEAKKAEKQAVKVSVDAIRKAGEKNWCAHAWILERMHPEQFADTRKLLKELQFALAQSQKLAEEQASELRRLRGDRADNPGHSGASESPAIGDGIGVGRIADDADADGRADSPSIRAVGE